MPGKTNKFHTAMRNEAKQLRKDARKLDTIAKHLRYRANDLMNQIRAEEKADAARANFFSKNAQVDHSLPLVPDLPEQDPMSQGADGPIFQEDQ